MYPTIGLSLPTIADDETRRVTCRAFNTFSADYFRNFSDRLTPVAVIPMHSPEEAIAELEHVKHQLGLKVVMLGSMIRRQIPAIAEEHPTAASVAAWYDVLGLDSEYDYDPCVGEVCRARLLADLPFRQQGLWPTRLAIELLLQPHWSFCGRR